MSVHRRWLFFGAVAFIFLCFLLGGSSRADVVQLALLRPLAIVWTAWIICFAPKIDWRVIRWPGGLLLAAAVVMVLQLVPLPFGWWTAMPGRETARSAMILTGHATVMHGWSLMPDRTLNSLFSLSVPAAMIMNLAALEQRDRRAILPWLAGAIAANMLLGFVQLIVGGGGRFRPFDTTDMEAAVGFFANRNHSAVLIAAALPLAACLATLRLRQPSRKAALQLIIIGVMVMALLAVLAIGSRSGLLMAVVGLLWAAVVAWQELRHAIMGRSRPMRWAIVLVPVVSVAGLIALALAASRGEAIRRLFDPAQYADIRIQSLPTSLAMMRDLFPFGSGFGTFEPMYRAAELRALLHLQYLNHAHNDYIELVIDAGLAGATILVLGFAWFVSRTVRSFLLSPNGNGFDRRLAIAASGVLLIAALASVTDYPVRTPIWMLVVAICAVWLNAGARPGPETDG